MKRKAPRFAGRFWNIPVISHRMQICFLGFLKLFQCRMSPIWRKPVQHLFAKSADSPPQNGLGSVRNAKLGILWWKLFLPLPPVAEEEKTVLAADRHLLLQPLRSPIFKKATRKCAGFPAACPNWIACWVGGLFPEQ